MKIKPHIISLSIVSLLALTFSCKKEAPDVIPTLTTSAITNIIETNATSGGRITSDGGASIISLGVCWSTNQTPTIANSKTVETLGKRIFSSSIFGLTPNTTYYVRAYATNSVGTGYGNVISFTSQSGIIFNPGLTYGSVKDIDGNIYKTIIIGSQTWMAENLKTTKYCNGDLIGTTTPAKLDILAESTPKYQWAYPGNENNAAIYGRLYTWFSATDSRNVCPTGWHIPTDSEWTTLINYLGGENIAGGKLKEVGTSHWISPNTDATNSNGFTALPGGYRHFSGSFEDFGYFGRWWSSTERGDLNPVWYICLENYFSIAKRYNFGNKKNAYSVRCVKDN